MVQLFKTRSESSCRPSAGPSAACQGHAATFHLLVLALWSTGCWQIAGIETSELPYRDDAVDMVDINEAEFDTPGDIDADDGIEEDIIEDDGTGILSAEEFCEGILLALCNYIFTCCTDLEQQDFSYYNCHDPTASQYYENCFNYIRPSIGAGKLVLIEDAFHECEAQLYSLADGCPGYGLVFYYDCNLYYSCSAVFEGRVHLGGSCRTDFECAGESFCSDGFCMPFIPLWDPCSYDDQCGPGIGFTCINYTCFPISGNGEPCDPDDYMMDCGPGLWCNMGICEPLLGPDLSCPYAYEYFGCEGLCDGYNLCTNYCAGP